MAEVDLLRRQAEVFGRLADSVDDPSMRLEVRRIAATCKEIIAHILREKRASSGAAWSRVSSVGAAFRAPV